MGYLTLTDGEVYTTEKISGSLYIIDSTDGAEGPRYFKKGLRIGHGTGEAGHIYVTGSLYMKMHASCTASITANGLQLYGGQSSFPTSYEVTRLNPRGSAANTIGSTKTANYRGLGINTWRNVAYGADSGFDYPFNSLHIVHSDTNYDNGILVQVNKQTTLGGGVGAVSAYTWLGGIGFDSTDGNTPVQVTHCSAFIGAYSSEAHGLTDKGAYMRFGTAATNEDDNTSSNHLMELSENGYIGIGTPSSATHTKPLKLLHLNFADPHSIGLGDDYKHNGIYHEYTVANTNNAHDFLITPLGKGAYRDLLGPSSYDGGTHKLYFYGVDEGGSAGDYWAISATGTTSFTGQHLCVPTDTTVTGSLSDYVGKIFVACDQGYMTRNLQEEKKLKKAGSFGADFGGMASGSDAIQINSALPKIAIATVEKDKRVIGVISNQIDDPMLDNNTDEYQTDDDACKLSTGALRHGLRYGQVRVNSIGEGGIWICDINGNVENGDYITTSIVPGYGMKQDDDLLRNYTVAKITMNCNFSGTDIPGGYVTSSITHNGTTYKTAFVGCTYHCG